MKVLFVNNGHFDATLPLINELSSEIDCTLNVQIEENVLRESILNFTFKSDVTGVAVEDSETEEVRKRLRCFLYDRTEIVFTKYRTRSFKDPRNWLVTYKWLRWIRDRRFDVIHYNGTSMLFLQQILMDRKCPRVFTIHDQQSHLGEESPQVHWLYKYISRRGENQFIGQSDFVARSFASLYRVGPERIRTVRFGPLGLAKESDDMLVPEEPDTVLFFGRISPYKGVEYLIEAWKTIRAMSPRAKLIIAGYGEFYFNAEEIRADTRVEIYNRYLDNHELAVLIQRASIVVLPYVEATQSGVVMTAYAFHKPVVATVVGALPEVVDDNVTGLLVPPRDPVSLANAILDLLTNPTKRAAFAKAIEEKVRKEFSWARIAEETIEVYRSCLG